MTQNHAEQRSSALLINRYRECKREQTESQQATTCSRSLSLSLSLSLSRTQTHTHTHTHTHTRTHAHTHTHTHTLPTPLPPSHAPSPPKDDAFCLRSKNQRYRQTMWSGLLYTVICREERSVLAVVRSKTLSSTVTITERRLLGAAYSAVRRSATIATGLQTTKEHSSTARSLRLVTDSW